MYKQFLTVFRWVFDQIQDSVWTSFFKKNVFILDLQIFDKFTKKWALPFLCPTLAKYTCIMRLDANLCNEKRFCMLKKDSNYQLPF